MTDHTEAVTRARDHYHAKRDRWRDVANSADGVIRAVLAEMGKGPDADPVIAARELVAERDRLATAVERARTEANAANADPLLPPEAYQLADAILDALDGPTEDTGSGGPEFGRPFRCEVCTLTHVHDHEGAE